MLQLVPVEWRFWALLVLVLVSYILAAVALFDDLQLYEWVTILPLPAIYTAAAGSFYFLLPESLLSQLVILVVFGLGMYAILLACNIFSVSKGRTIQLHNAASAMALFVAMVSSLLLMNTIYSMHWEWWMIGAMTMFIHLPLFYILNWSVSLEGRIWGRSILYAVVGVVLLGELAIILAFLPIVEWASGLLVMAGFYWLVNVFNGLLEGKFIKQMFREYGLLAVAWGAVLILLFPLR